MNDGSLENLEEPAEAADPQALESAIEELLRNDVLRAGMGQAARRRVEAEFSDAVMLQRIEALYRELL